MNPTTDDPTTLSALPPRHALESDSEEDDDAAFRRAGGAGRARPKRGPVDVAVSWQGGERDSATLVVAGEDAAGKFFDGFASTDAGNVTLKQGGEIVGLLSTLATDVVLLVLKPGLHHSIPAPVALAVLEAISPVRVLAIGSYVASSYLPSALEERSRASDGDDDDERLRFLSTSASCTPPAGLYPFSPPNHLLSPLAPFLTLLPLSTPPTTLLLLPAPRPTLATLRALGCVVAGELDGLGVDGWDEERFVKGGRRGKWGRKEVDAGSMYM